jgi:hypothetical protein
VARHLTGEERDDLVARTRALLDTRTYPEPEGDRHPYPWPLV